MHGHPVLHITYNDDTNNENTKIAFAYSFEIDIKLTI